MPHSEARREVSTARGNNPIERVKEILMFISILERIGLTLHKHLLFLQFSTKIKSTIDNTAAFS